MATFNTITQKQLCRAYIRLLPDSVIQFFPLSSLSQQTISNTRRLCCQTPLALRCVSSLQKISKCPLFFVFLLLEESITIINITPQFITIRCVKINLYDDRKMYPLSVLALMALWKDLPFKMSRNYLMGS